MNSTRNENADPAMKSPKTRSWRRTRKGFEAVRAAFSSRPKGREYQGHLRRQAGLVWGLPHLRRLSLHLILDIPI
jgi:hypothetical protein